MITQTFTPKEIIYSRKDLAQTVPVTIKAGVTYDVGQVIARKTSTGLYEAYDPAGGGGVEQASGILAVAVDTSSAGLNEATVARMYLPTRVVYYEDQLVGLDASALLDLGKGVSIAGRNLVVI